jgi:hypothetical protein
MKTDEEYLREVRQQTARAKLLFGERAFASKAAHPDSPRSHAILIAGKDEDILLGCGPDWTTALARAAEEFPKLCQPGHLPHLRVHDC